MKRILYNIPNMDDPKTIWRLNLDNTVEFWNSNNTVKFWNSTQWEKTSVNIHETINGAYRFIPKREAKYLFPEAFK